MGVIDLDARVKKLEQDAGGGAVIDQLEAAVTALEETVNGDGDTDLGLVGDVADLDEQINGDGETDFGLAGDVEALETAIAAAPTTVSDLSSGLTSTATWVDTVKLYAYGSLRLLTMKTSWNVPTDYTTAVVIPSGSIPSNNTACACAMTNTADFAKGGFAIVQTDGNVKMAVRQGLSNLGTNGVLMFAIWTV